VTARIERFKRENPNRGIESRCSADIRAPTWSGFKRENPNRGIERKVSHTGGVDNHRDSREKIPIGELKE